jgi:chromosome partitioning protein
MRIITLVTQKGGTGKSTIATGLAVTATQAGEKVIALDLDPQGTLAAWAHIRQQPTPSVAQLPARETGRLTELLATAAKSFTVALVDTPGADSPMTHNAMTAADLCLVPLRPTRPDGLAIKPTVEALIRGKKRFAFVLNQCPTTPRNSRAAEMASGLSSLGFLAEPMVCQRADYQDAFAAGQGVTEYSPDSKAADEMRQLWNWINRETKEKQV